MAAQVDKQKILDLLGCGLDNETVSSAVGCESSYISQLMADEEFRAAVVFKRSESLKANTDRDRKIDSMEDDLIAKLSDAIASGMIYKPGDILRTFAVVNKAERRGLKNTSQHIPVNQNIVQLNIPTIVQQQFTLSKEGEVVEINGQTMVSMPAHQLLKQLAGNRENENASTYERLAGFLPNSESAGGEVLQALTVGSSNEPTGTERPLYTREDGTGPKQFRNLANRQPSTKYSEEGSGSS